ncbi:hypothetical protein FIBSPDRAFT_1055089 [Athelia psychrophila]|uniref:Uncharacterized protein n=1 Tax=Athelia psychrophila TaxID=1759441 RepID=A0A167UBY4_9AGAM|nr:hypothetical protein FIBSPDRAFT_1055089 [Fibularhizoctonia sp. CBS 109695]
MSRFNTYPTDQSNVTNIGGDYLIILHGDIIIHMHPPAGAMSPDRDHANAAGASAGDASPQAAQHPDVVRAPGSVWGLFLSMLGFRWRCILHVLSVFRLSRRAA